MSIISLSGIIVLLAYFGLLVTGIAKNKSLLAFKWLAISIAAVAVIYTVGYVLQDALPRLYELTPLLCAISLLITLILGFTKILANPVKINT